MPTIIKLLLFKRIFYASIKSIIMSYIYKGKEYSIEKPVKSISVNKLNVAVKDQSGVKLFEFSNLHESKKFLSLLYKA